MKKDQFFSENLISWYKQNKRRLPWRKNVNDENYPYKVMVSEFMLQQTGVSTVIPYFENFINRWPTIVSLASAREEDILLAWQGLGYYRRARNLLKSAKQICNQYDSKVPKSLEELQSLPGIGVYASGAIRSIAFDKKAVAVDGNVKRVLARYYGFSGRLDQNEKLINEQAIKCCPDKSNRQYTQAVMEHGALVCTPKVTKCGVCILSSKCYSYKNKIVDQIPEPKLKTKKQKLNCISFLSLRGDREVLLKKRPKNAILGNQWELPSTNWSKTKHKFDKNLCPVPSKLWNKLNVNFTHKFSHIDLSCSVYFSDAESSKKLISNDEYKWVNLRDISNYPVTTMSLKTLNELNLIQI